MLPVHLVLRQAWTEDYLLKELLSKDSLGYVHSVGFTVHIDVAFKKPFRWGEVVHLCPGLQPIRCTLINNLTCSPKGLWVNSPYGKAKWAISPWPLRVNGLIIVLVSPN